MKNKKAMERSGDASVNESSIHPSPTDLSPNELERRLIEDADAWAKRYERKTLAVTPADQPIRSRSTDSHRRFDADEVFATGGGHRFLAVTLLAACLVAALSLSIWNERRAPVIDSPTGSPQLQSVVRENSVEPLVASAAAVDEICGKTFAAFQRQNDSFRQWRNVALIDVPLAPSLEQIELPGRQYGRALAWIDQRLQRVIPENAFDTTESPDFEP